MSNDSPDFITPVIVSVSSTFTAIDELAARLGSSDTFDRRGNVVYAHDMSEGLAPYLINESGTGDSVAVDTTEAFYGGQSLLITGGSVLNDSTGISKRHRLPSSQYMGLEMVFKRHAAQNRFTMGMTYTKDAIQYSPQIGLDLSVDQLFYLDSGLIRQELLSVDVSDFSTSWWVFLKFVLDIENHTYHRTIFENTEIAHAHAIANTPSNQPDFVSPSVIVRSDGNANQLMHIGSFIHTVNEQGN